MTLHGPIQRAARQAILTTLLGTLRDQCAPAEVDREIATALGYLELLSTIADADRQAAALDARRADTERRLAEAQAQLAKLTAALEEA